MQEVEVVPLGRSVVKVPILMYHYIRVNPNPRDSMGFALSVTPDDFRRQMDLLSERRYNPIVFEELRAYWSGQQPLPSTTATPTSTPRPTRSSGSTASRPSPTWCPAS
jgi:hypothetical protein